MNILQESGETQVKTLIDDVQDYQTEGQLQNVRQLLVLLMYCFVNIKNFRVMKLKYD